MSGPKYPVANIPDRIEEHVKSATIFNREDPDSVFNRTIGLLHEAIVRVETNKTGIRNTKLHHKGIRDLIKPEPRDAKLRTNFWEEYARAVDRDTHMRVEYIPSGVCSFDVFLDYLTDPEKVGYLLNAPTSYMKNAEDVLNVAMDRIRDIMDLPLVNSKGQVQGAVVNAVLKAADMLDKRVRGAVMQKLAIHQHNTVGAMPQSAELAHDQVAMLEKQISEVRKNIGERYAVIPAISGADILVEKTATDDET